MIRKRINLTSVTAPFLLIGTSIVESWNVVWLLNGVRTVTKPHSNLLADCGFNSRLLHYKFVVQLLIINCRMGLFMPHSTYDKTVVGGCGNQARRRSECITNVRCLLVCAPPETARQLIKHQVDYLSKYPMRCATSFCEFDLLWNWSVAL